VLGNPLVRDPCTRNAAWIDKKERKMELSKLKVTARDYFNKKKQMAMALGKIYRDPQNSPRQENSRM